ncbi:MAG: thioredoxin family protein [Acidimicrobiia bacterium]
MSAAVQVELVYLDECPHWRDADRRIREAMHRVGLDPGRVRYHGVTTTDAAADFPGSPTILLDGRDVFPAPAPAGPTCRRYSTEQGVEGAPSLEQLVDVFTRSFDPGPEGR